jgi:hypothetical protein
MPTTPRSALIAAGLPAAEADDVLLVVASRGGELCSAMDRNAAAYAGPQHVAAARRFWYSLTGRRSRYHRLLDAEAL